MLRPRDPELGLIHIRLTTWFPFNIQIYVNGHSWLAHQMLQQRRGFSQQDNTFTALDDPPCGSETGRFVRRPSRPCDSKARLETVRSPAPLLCPVDLGPTSP